MLTLFHMALISMFILMIMGIVSNVNQTAFTAVENQIFLMNCPYPINGGIAQNTNIEGLTVTYDLVRDNSTQDYNLTLFDCEVTDPDIPLYAVSTTVLTTPNDWFNVAGSYLAYLMNYIFSVTGQVNGALTLFSFILTPANFEIMGFTLSDLSGSAVMIVVGLYLVSYAIIISWLYVTFNPFKGASA